jgi:glucose/arabinose dehydrogenase
MIGRVPAFLLGVAAIGVACGAPAAAAPSLPPNFNDQIVVGNLFEPTGMAFLPDGRLLVIERPGRVRLIVDGKLGLVDPLLEPDSVDASSPESGLLGIAVDPGWPVRPFVYLHHTRLGARQCVVRYEASGDLSDGSSVILTIDPGSRYVVLDDLLNLDPGRNGGALEFGTDGKLYVGLGDDGSECAAQDSTSLRGVLLRLDTSALPLGPGGPPDRSVLVPSDNPFANRPAVNTRLVWSLGLRDPIRFRFDPGTGSLFVGDAGGSGAQEIERVVLPGIDFGWPHEQGWSTRANACDPMNPNGFVRPVWTYADTDLGGLARIVAGGVYAGSGCGSCFPSEYLADFFYADSRVGFIRRVREIDGGDWGPAPEAPGQPNPDDWGTGYQTIADLAPGPDGGLWYCHQGTGGADGEVRRIVYAAPTGSVAARVSAGIELLPPAPIPTRGAVALAYRLERAGSVALEILDASGRRVRTLIANANQPAGRHAAAWDGRTESGTPAPAGLYVARLRVDGAALSRRIPLIR